MDDWHRVQYVEKRTGAAIRPLPSDAKNEAPIVIECDSNVDKPETLAVLKPCYLWRGDSSGEKVPVEIILKDVLSPYIFVPEDQVDVIMKQTEGKRE